MKKTFWPMIGGISEGFSNYLVVLRYIERAVTSKDELVDWLVAHFKLKKTYAANVITTLFTGAGLVNVAKGRCVLTSEAQTLLEKSSPDYLYHIFAGQFIGINDMVLILKEEQTIGSNALFEEWHTRIRKRWNPLWSTKHARMQYKHRLDWLRSLEIVKKVADSYYLSKSGMKAVVRDQTRTARSADEREVISHNDFEDKLVSIGEFFDFMSIKRASVNDARPTQASKLRENRQLDCLWARLIPFGGKVQYAFEIQLGGNISDAIERLEMVAIFVQKAVVVTDEEQQEKIQNRLVVKHSPLRDKIVFLSYEDIENVAEGVNALKVFTSKIFHD